MGFGEFSFHDARWVVKGTMELGGIFSSKVEATIGAPILHPPAEGGAEGELDGGMCSICIGYCALITRMPSVEPESNRRISTSVWVCRVMQ